MLSIKLKAKRTRPHRLKAHDDKKRKRMQMTRDVTRCPDPRKAQTREKSHEWPCELRAARPQEPAVESDRDDDDPRASKERSILPQGETTLHASDTRLAERDLYTGDENAFADESVHTRKRTWRAQRIRQGNWNGLQIPMKTILTTRMLDHLSHFFTGS